MKSMGTCFMTLFRRMLHRCFVDYEISCPDFYDFYVCANSPEYDTSATVAHGIPDISGTNGQACFCTAWFGIQKQGRL